MAALATLTQLSSGNPVYENFYRQVDPGNTGRVGPTEAALFLKKSGLPDITLGKIWDLADPDGKGFLDKQGFYVALRLVACAQSGHDISISSLNLPVPPPKFKDHSSPSLSSVTSTNESHWAVRPEEKSKFDGIFESLAPVNGLLSGEKVKPVLINSKLPVDVLGKVWDLSDIDKDGHLDRDEFAVAMHLVYRALEKEPVPSVLPSSLIPPSKRKKSSGSLSSMVPVLPGSPPPPKDSLRSTPSHGSMNSLNSAGSLSPKHTLKSSQHSVNWVVPVADRGRYDDIFLKTDSDLDGFVSGLEVKDIFMQSGLHQNLLAHIWALADTRQMGKLTREQFSLAMYLIQQKVSKGLDPPQALTPDMIPPSERGTPGPSLSGYMTPVGSDMAALTEMRRAIMFKLWDSSSSVGSGEFTGIKELDDISQEIAQLQSTLAFTHWDTLREKYTLEQDIRETEEAIRHKTTEVQEMQNDLDRETSSLQELEAQKQDAQDRLEEMDQQKAKLEDMLNDVRQKCQEESQMISSLQTQIHSQESDLQSQEEELGRAKADLNRLQQEEAQLEQSLQAGRIQLETIIKSLKATQDEINQARSKLSQIQDSQHEISKNIEQYSSTLNGTHGGSMTNLADMSEGFPEKENGGFGAMEDPFKVKPTVFNSAPQEMHTDPFQSEDPFKTDPFKEERLSNRFVKSGGDPFQNDPFSKPATTVPDPFGGDPFKETDPFRTSSEDFFKKPSKPDPFTNADPFSKSATLPSKSHHFASNDPFISTSPKPKGQDFFGTLDPFGSSTFGSNSGFADFSQMSKGFVEDPFSRKQDMPALPPKKSIPPRPKPPSGKSTPVNVPGSGDPAKTSDPFQPFSADPVDPFQCKKGVGDPFSGKDPFAPSAPSKASKDSSLGFADFSSEPSELSLAMKPSRWSGRSGKARERNGSG
ncbi:epidermal growth factor receptor substrate 15-like 1 isoform X8 [Danio rerio]|uniref:Epidermal growth factor receptor substrate 15-like 1 isoform X7 n=1 Tax=Danio rerio TaxID=7955 RepID=A0A8M3AXR7_DANRE|nr:epidermal growth factor receptor substrate 15-like 1 isoform X7 [Danio rerio]XP_021330138.1 epidermal growth factor receptor substrate 15-like 1 isoform X7 [Danio rerio]|eukprot:XP_009294595.1 epidermal growth factor receptor substrate 15-like 1 isoform X7 [Danio rerio]